jgi:hypothetical protein
MRVVLASFAILLLSALSVIGIAAAAAPSPAMALVFPPWWNEHRSFLSAAEGGPVLSMGGMPFVVLVPASSHPVRARGEWLRIFAPARMGCFSTGERT